MKLRCKLLRVCIALYCSHYYRIMIKRLRHYVEK
ncbi:hypothetical protein T11_11125 [Trichinella zimbabwensis]|uniref:Uncharacterized protein n=1 Tax=Trichinella zimbabwensis TaxID=268475 RepID=A0A0V1ESR2_9BILA|nr:hypothetical protein T11_11125 [Trichinella zimbabwensis]